MLARLSAFVVWGVVAATLVFWGLRLGVTSPVAPANVLAAADSGPAHGDLSRLLGAPVVEAQAAVIAPEVASRFRLLGVMAPKASVPAGPRRPGVALIAVDGNPPRAYSVGSALDGELVLQSVSLRSASIGPARGSEALKLELPPLPAPATGTLPGLRPGAGPVPPRGIVPRSSPVGEMATPEQIEQRQLDQDSAVQRDQVGGAPTE